MIAVLQLLYASTTLYDTRGNQLKFYGYAAFGLTVAPYLVVSLVNLVGVLVTPDFPTLYMVESEIMEEVKQRDSACFRGMVGRLEAPEQSIDLAFRTDEQCRKYIHKCKSNYDDGRGFVPGQIFEVLVPQQPRITGTICLVPACHSYPGDSEWLSLKFYLSRLSLSFILGLLAVAINGCLSHLKAGGSIRPQRAWTMTWLSFNILLRSDGVMEDFRGDHWDQFYFTPDLGWFTKVEMLICGFPAIGGLVVVGQMSVEYGYCVKIY